MKALVIGFEGYQGRLSNPAATVAKALNGETVNGAIVSGATMRVSYRELPGRVHELLGQHKPDVVLGTGLWPGEPVIRVEQLAYNRADFETADVDGAVVHDSELDPGGPVALEASIPTEKAVAKLLEAGIPARSSQTAGTFLCNALLYTLLAAARSEYPQMRCGFVHLPYLPEQVAGLVQSITEERSIGLYQRADLASMDPRTATEALRIVLEVATSSVSE
ncbi:MAG TPA: pyroglutamyl-peptidase I [Gammaproteobacteria bacterium]|nr:pyroglutamyl-peptidase I [Gammaproteobacteria bacterium]